MQNIIIGRENFDILKKYILNKSIKKYLLVCDNSYKYIDFASYLETIDVPCVVFNDFSSNPRYEDVCKGVNVFNNQKCDFIVAVGGGSAIDVAKCIKLFSIIDNSAGLCSRDKNDSEIDLLAIPTTAGTGSESTRFAVIYKNDIKQSISNDKILPNVVYLDSNLLKSLPLYQKKCTLLDALCQGIESYWSINSTVESKYYASMTIDIILKNYKNYIEDCSPEAYEKILLASNYSGRAINISQTTAAHAMSYKITSLFNLPHGHAVAICLPKIWRFMLNNIDKCCDQRGQDYLKKTFEEISVLFNVKKIENAVDKFEEILGYFNLEIPIVTENDINLLSVSVNEDRLKNNPIKISSNIKEIYNEVFLKKKL